jgi:glycosyltransferase involved in cell wall biosynthesis
MISVVMPLFNAADTVERSVRSVMAIQIVGELIVIDDGSQDGSIEIILNLKTSENRIKLFTHENNQNKGAAASRNLGIEKATFDYIAFLDADDWYLPNRFDNTVEYLTNYLEIDGLYGVSKEVFASEKAKELFFRSRNQIITKLNREISSKDLFYALFYGVDGEFHISTLTIRKDVLKEIGLFNEKIRNVEDTELFFRLTLKYSLVCNGIDIPISERLVHENNSIHDFDSIRIQSDIMYAELFFWSLNNEIKFEVQNLFFNRIDVIRPKLIMKLIKDFNFWTFMLKKIICNLKSYNK